MSEGKAPDPGWNDPPTFSYDKASEIQANAGRRGVSLNKRVAFPLSGPGRNSSGGTDPTIPPSPIDVSRIGAPPIGSPPTGTPPRLPPVCPPVSSSCEVQKQEISLQEVLDNIGAVYNLNEDDDISKRIKMMENMWIDKKLDSAVQRRILELSQALRDGDIPTADRVQKSLMVDYVAVCSSWMGGMRQLINLRREDQEQEQDVSVTS